MFVLGQKKKPQRIVLRPAVPPSAAVRKGRKIVVPAGAGEPEAFVVMAPITGAMRRRAMGAARRLLGAVDNFEDVSFDLLADAAEVGSREMIRLGAIEWGGIGDADGNPVELTPDRETRFKTANDPDRPTGTIDLLLDDEDFFDRMEVSYIGPDAIRRAEKNASSASPNGTGGAATRASATVSCRAKPTAKKRAAKNAPTGKTRSKAKRAKASGRR